MTLTVYDYITDSILAYTGAFSKQTKSGEEMMLIEDEIRAIRELLDG